MLWYCYILQSLDKFHSNRTYVGKTNNPQRRLRQHNGEIKGGAKYTKAYRPYQIVCLIEGFTTERDALRFEWHLKHIKTSTKNRGVFRRADALKALLTSSWLSIHIPYTTLHIYVHDDYVETFNFTAGDQVQSHLLTN
jgi:predicted GIY-YIG superfamily endonuclease